MPNLRKYVPTEKGSAKAWSNLNGTGTIAERDSFNISSHTDNGVGDYTHNFSNNMSDADYAGSATAGLSSTTTGSYGGFDRIGATGLESAPAASSIRVNSIRETGASDDNKYVRMTVFGSLAA